MFNQTSSPKNHFPAQNKLNRKRAAALLRHNSLSQIFTSLYPDYLLENCPKNCYQEILTNLQILCESQIKSAGMKKKHTGDLFLRKACQLALTQGQKKIIEEQLGGQYKIEQQNGSKMLYEMISHLIGEEEEEEEENSE